MIYESQEQLEVDLRWWQKALRVQDWDISATIERDHDVMEGCQGDCHATPIVKTASIRLLHPTDYPPRASWPQDHEQTLVHELLHIATKMFEPEDREGYKYLCLEQFIDQTATALVDLRRGMNEKEHSDGRV